MNMATLLKVRAASFVATCKERLTERDDRGAGFIEYAAIIVLAAAVMGLVWGGLEAADLNGKIAQAVTDIFTAPGGE